VRPFRFPFSTRLSFPLLTELVVGLPLRDEELELLLPACPQLLRLNCVVSQGWDVVRIAARCCSGLLDLKARLPLPHHFVRIPAAAASQPVAKPFLPQLIALRLIAAVQGRLAGVFDFSPLRHLTAPPHAQLRHIRLTGLGLSAQHVRSFARLPQLSYLHAQRNGPILPVHEAHMRTRERLLSRAAAGSADRDAHRPILPRENCEGSVRRPPLGSHQQQEMRQRVQDELAPLQWMWHNLLLSVDGVDISTGTGCVLR
jgi:hypothetical protein